MCLIITFFVAVITTGIWYYNLLAKNYMLGRLVLIYWGAVLMWSVDGFFNLANKDAFYILTLNDALLGIVIVFCGLVLWSLMLLWKNYLKVRFIWHK